MQRADNSAHYHLIGVSNLFCDITSYIIRLCNFVASFSHINLCVISEIWYTLNLLKCFDRIAAGLQYYHLNLCGERCSFVLLQMPGETWGGKFKHFLGLITVEPTMVLYMLAFMLTSVVEQSFFVYKACRVNHGLNDTICKNITAEEYEDYNKEVQVTIFLFWFCMMNEWINEWRKEWLNDSLNDWMNDWLNEWMNE